VPEASPLVEIIRKRLNSGDLPFREFMELALYHPAAGYYSTAKPRVGKGGDYVTSPTLSPLFAFAVARLIREVLGRAGDGVSTIVDIGCGDGTLIHSLYEEFPAGSPAPAWYGVDRSLSRVERRGPVHFVESLTEVPAAGSHILLANELFDALPFARVVQREEGLHELCVTERDGELDWSERPAPAEYRDYFAARGIELQVGQFADISPEWERTYEAMCRFLTRGLVVVFDYGHPEKQLFDGRVRRFGTAASYRGQRVSRELLADPGERDLTAHINFTDLIRAGEREGLATLFFDRQAKFLLALGAAEHQSLRPIEDMTADTLDDGLRALEAREDARRMLLPDGIGEDIRVLVQAKGLDVNGWSFQRELFRR
jgi:SAM-dependent MidA family methyltransferase